MNILINTRIFLGLFGVLCLFGCVDIEQEIWIKSDASAQLQHRVGLYEPYLVAQGVEAKAATCTQFYESKTVLMAHAEISSVELNSYMEGGVFYCEQMISLQDYTHLEQVQAWALNGSQIESLKNDFLTEFTLRKQPDGQGMFRQHIRNKSSDSGKSILESHAEHLTNTLMGHLFSGRYWTTTLHTFKIDETNGTLSEDQTSVTWRVALYDLMLNQDYTLDMQAKFIAQPAWYKRLWHKLWHN